MYKDQKGWMGVYRDLNALWTHDDKNPLNPHVQLSGGLHSSELFCSEKIISDNLLIHQAASDLCDLIEAEGDKGRSIMISVTCVVGPQTGATKLSEALAAEIGRRRHAPCAWASPSKRGEGASRHFIFDESCALTSADRVLLCDDVITTCGSVELAAQAVREKGASVLPCVCSIVNRSNLVVSRGKEILSLVRRLIPKWVPDECPLCIGGSEAISAKDLKNQSRLTAAA